MLFPKKYCCTQNGNYKRLTFLMVMVIMAVISSKVAESGSDGSKVAESCCNDAGDADAGGGDGKRKDDCEGEKDDDNGDNEMVVLILMMAMMLMVVIV